VLAALPMLRQVARTLCILVAVGRSLGPGIVAVEAQDRRAKHAGNRRGADTPPAG